MRIDKQTAKRRLTNRWLEQCEKFPQTKLIPLSLYIRRNIAQVMRDGLLIDYSNRA